MPSLTVRSNTSNGMGLRSVQFDDPVDGHHAPGQFVQLSSGEIKGYFALANDPGTPAELLVKPGGAMADVVAALHTGSTVDSTPAIGDGFAMPSGDRPIIMLVTGSGISAVRPLIRAELSQDTTRPIILYYGVLTPEHRSFSSELEAWESAGVDVRIVLGEPTEAWQGRRGFVQDAAQEDGLVRSGITLVLCGFPAMVTAAKEMWGDAGLEAEHMVTNF